MKANDRILHQILEGEKQYVVPVFQRRYSWKRQQWEELWRDLLNLLEGESEQSHHFFGTFVCSVEASPGEFPTYYIIDGQQRLSTVVIILSILRDITEDIDTDELSGRAEEKMENLQKEIEENYLIHRFKDGWDRYRVISRAEDREILRDVIEGNSLQEGDGITSAYDYYRGKIQGEIEERGEGVLRDLFNIIIKRLSLVMITLDEDENPFTIFETLNERGLPLEESDLIRNYIFMQLPQEEQDKFNEEKWRSFEEMFEETERYEEINMTDFYRDYLMRDGDYVRKNEIYIQFKERTEQNPWDLIEELKDYAEYYTKIHRPEKVQEPEIKKNLKRINRLNVGTSYPLILHLFKKYDTRELSLEHFVRCLSVIESFVLRRSICELSSRSYNYWFPEAVRKIGEDTYPSLIKFLNEKGWPTDTELKESIIAFDIYVREHEKCRLILEELEKSFEHKEPVQFSNLEIEHIMPQTIEENEDGESWKEMLGEDWEHIHEEWQHTIGNLTLTGYNPELSTKKFTTKQEKLAESHLEMNNYFRELQEWNKSEIKARAEELADKIAEIWPREES